MWRATEAGATLLNSRLVRTDSSHRFPPTNPPGGAAGRGAWRARRRRRGRGGRAQGAGGPGGGLPAAGGHGRRQARVPAAVRPQQVRLWGGKWGEEGGRARQLCGGDGGLGRGQEPQAHSWAGSRQRLLSSPAGRRAPPAPAPAPAPARDLIADHEKRATTHQQLLGGLRGVNRMVARAAKLRAGPPAARVVAACRAAVKAGEVAALAWIVRDGGGGAAPA